MMVRQGQVRQQRPSGWRSFRAASLQSQQLASGVIRAEGSQNLDLHTARDLRPPVGQIDDLALPRSVYCSVRLVKRLSRPSESQ
jgi:hypothetical protein